MVKLLSLRDRNDLVIIIIPNKFYWFRLQTIPSHAILKEDVV